jgi:hypothetical protein
VKLEEYMEMANLEVVDRDAVDREGVMTGS